MNIIEFASDTFSAQETNGQVSVVVVREGNSAAALSVNLNVIGGTATAGQDYLLPPTVVTFAPLEVSKGVVIPILDNNFLEPSKTISLALTNPSLGLLGPRVATTVIIHDDEVAPSNLDTNFNLNPMFLALQHDNKILASFGIGLARFMPDGTLDQAFQFVFAASIKQVVVLPDGKILMGGNFSTVGLDTNLVARSGLARFDTNGILDLSFNPEIDAAGVCGIALQSDGKILLAGVSSPVSTGFTRLLPNGQLDTSFQVYAPLGLSDPPEGAVAVQSDGKILIGANFYLVNGEQRSGLARLNSDGSLDPNFAPTVTGGNFTSAGVNAIQPLPDGRIWVGGVFTLVNGVAMGGITRLNPNGSLDASFDPAGGVDGPVTTLLAQPDGRILIAGGFGTVGATARAKLARLNTDGSLDVGFAPALPSNTSILTLGRQSDGALLLGGRFCESPPPDCDDCDDDDDYNCTGTLRIKPDAVLRFLTPEIAAGGVVRVSAEVVPGRRYVLQSSTDLAHWTSIATNWPAATPWNYSTTLSPSTAKFYRALETQ